MPIVDCHAHVLTHKLYPRELFVGRFGVPRFLVSALVDAVNGSHEMCWPARLAWWLMPRKLKRYELLARIYAGSESGQLEYLRQEAVKSGVSQVWLLGLDIPSVGDFQPVHESPALVSHLEFLEHAASTGVFVPFYPFDPRRADAVEALGFWLSRGKFRGVKMYPALGFNVEGAVRPSWAWHQPLREAFEFLQEAQIPIVAHCSPGGVRGPEIRRGDMRWLSSPERWAPVLENFPRLKLCLAHGTGEGGFLSLSNPKPRSWAWHLRELMARFPGVYTDTAFHEGIVSAGPSYRARFAQLMAGPFRDRLLFGSDAPLHYGEYSYRHLILAARENLHGVDDLLAENARRFLAARV